MLFRSTSSQEESPLINKKHTEFIHATNLITVRTIKDLYAIEKPPQSVVNIIISYVSVLGLIDKSNKLIHKNKTYANCKKTLKNAEYIQKITLELIKYCEQITDEEKKKLNKIRNKYLVGSDMRPEAFSDKYYSARTILYFILSLCCYIGNDSPLSKRRNSSDSPTRKLIEHKTLKTKGELQLRNQTHIHPKTTSELFNKLAYNYSDADDW